MVFAASPRDFKVHAVAHDYDAVEGQPRFGAATGNKLVDGLLVNAARGWRAEAVEHANLQ
jgi:hypothetical protein